MTSGADDVTDDVTDDDVTINLNLSDFYCLYFFCWGLHVVATVTVLSNSCWIRLACSQGLAVSITQERFWFWFMQTNGPMDRRT